MLKDPLLLRGGGKIWRKKMLCAEKQKNHYFSNSGGQMPPPCPHPPNEVPACYVLNCIQSVFYVPSTPYTPYGGVGSFSRGPPDLQGRGPHIFFQCGKAGEQTRAGGASTLAWGPGPHRPPDAMGLTPSCSHSHYLASSRNLGSSLINKNQSFIKLVL